MAGETSKTRRVWGELERSVLRGDGIDIGCGPDPVFPDVRRFDREHGDANEIGRFVDRQFDFVYASHCLEHMVDPRTALAGWWSLVKPGGVLFLIVPDEDLYEQGVWPSRFNSDHKWTFTISKHRSWSPVSINLLDLAKGLPGGELVDIRLQDDGYERWRLSIGYPPGSPPYKLRRALARLNYGILRGLGFNRETLKRYFVHPSDQTVGSDALAQIQCIVRKAAT